MYETELFTLTTQEDSELESVSDQEQEYITLDEDSDKEIDPWKIYQLYDSKEIYNVETTDDLTEEQQQIINQIPEDIISTTGNDLGSTQLICHRIPLEPDARPIAHPPYRLNQEKKDFLMNEINQMLDKGIIRESESPWASPVVIVPKKTGDLKICVDYRPLNNITITDSYPYLICKTN